MKGALPIHANEEWGIFILILAIVAILQNSVTPEKLAKGKMYLRIYQQHCLAEFLGILPNRSDRGAVRWRSRPTHKASNDEIAYVFIDRFEIAL